MTSLTTSRENIVTVSRQKSHVFWLCARTVRVIMMGLFWNFNINEVLDIGFLYSKFQDPRISESVFTVYNVTPGDLRIWSHSPYIGHYGDLIIDLRSILHKIWSIPLILIYNNCFCEFPKKWCDPLNQIRNVYFFPIFWKFILCIHIQIILIF